MTTEQITALVSGANRGLGKRFAAQLVERGAKVYAGARRPETIDTPGVVPIRLEGIDRVLHQTWRWPRRGNVRVTFGAPLVLEGNDYAALTRRVQDAVVALQPLHGGAEHVVPDAAA